MLDKNGNNASSYVPFFGMLTDGGTENFAANYAVTGADASYTPGALSVVSIRQLQIILSWDENADATIDWQKFGKLAALTNGLDFNVTRGGFVSNLLQDGKLKCNGQLPNPVFSLHSKSHFFVSTWCFPAPIILNGTLGDTFAISLADNFSTLDALRFNIVADTGNAI